MAALTASDPQRNQSSSAPKSGPASYRASLRAYVFVGFSDNRRLAIVVRFGVVVLVLVIVGVSRRIAPMVTSLHSAAAKLRWGMVGPLDAVTFMRGCYCAGPRSSKERRRQLCSDCSLRLELHS